MTAALLLPLLLPPAPCQSSEQEPASLLRSLVPAPTGINGYEEYLSAADLVRTPACQTALRLANQTLAGNPGWLQVQRGLAGASPGVRDLVLLGNTKPVKDPRTEVSYSTLFREYTHFKTVQRLLAADAAVRFVDGSPREAVGTLNGMLKFSLEVQSTGVLLSYLVGVACQSIALKAYSDGLDQIPLGSLNGVAALCDEGLKRPAYRGAILAEGKYTEKSISDMAQDKGAAKVLLGLGEDEPDELAARIEKMPAAEYVAHVERAREVARRLYDALVALVDSPESQWAVQAPRARAIYEEEQDTVARALVQTVAVASNQLFVAELKRRTQLRLLKLHMAIRAYRLNANRLPSSLDDLNDQHLTRDPLNGKPFVYVPQGQSYELYSLGAFDTGRIDLVYKRSLKSDTGTEGPVKP